MSTNNTGPAQLLAQLQAIWKQLGSSQRVTVVLTALAVVGGLTAVALWSGRTDYALLYGKLGDAEAAKVIAALDESKVPYRISRGGGSIHIPADQVHRTRMQLAAKGIPKSGEGVGFEIFDKASFGISDFQQRANYLRAIQGELSRTIAEVDAIESARVMIVMPENRLLIDNNRKPTASVFVRVRGNVSPPPQTVAAIRFLVANSVEGLQPGHVSVIDNLGSVLSENHEGDSIAGLTTTQLAARKELEQYLVRKAQGMLETVLGPNQAVVRVSAEINFDTSSRTEEKLDPEKIERSQTVNTESTKTLSTTPTVGPVGARTNANTDTNAAVGVANNSTTEKTVETKAYDIGRTSTTLMQAAGGIRRLSAAVLVAATMEGTGSARKPVPRPKEELDKLRRMVQSALGIQEGVNSTRQDQITLEEIPFNEQPALEAEKQLQSQERRELWTGILGSAAYPLLAAAALFFLWRLWQKSPAEGIPIGIPLGPISAHANGAANGKGHLARAGDHRGQEEETDEARGFGDRVSVDALNRLIQDNPDNMTQAIRSWMTQGNAK